MLNTHPHQQAGIPAQSEAPSGSGWLFPNPLPAAWRMTFNRVYRAYLRPFCLSDVCLSFTEIVMNHQPLPKKVVFANRATAIISTTPPPPQRNMVASGWLAVLSATAIQGWGSQIIVVVVTAELRVDHQISSLKNEHKSILINRESTGGLLRAHM